MQEIILSDKPNPWVANSLRNHEAESEKFQSEITLTATMHAAYALIRKSK
jgi:hypothetical protein